MSRGMIIFTVVVAVVSFLVVSFLIWKSINLYIDTKHTGIGLDRASKSMHHVTAMQIALAIEDPQKQQEAIEMIRSSMKEEGFDV